MLELARAGDWEEVKRLSVQIHDLHVAWRPDIYFHCDEPYPKEKFLEDIAMRTVYVARIADAVVGYVTLSFLNKGGPGTVPKKQMRLDSICVDEALRGKGLGKAMVADVRALAKAFGCREVILSVHPENDEAVGFYQKCGFRIRTIGMDMII
jgi:ribosomal protein S18 acetylase RimI-like enzyme